jgi:hypothetical protein
MTLVKLPAIMKSNIERDWLAKKTRSTFVTAEYLLLLLRAVMWPIHEQPRRNGDPIKRQY